LFIYIYIAYKISVAVVGSAPVPPAAQPTELSIEATIQQVKSKLKDINCDGEINCVDYSIIFYSLYPHSKMIQAWDDKGFNHMLNKVGDRYVEPQAADGDPYKVWPVFKTAYKKDVTGRWQAWAFNIRTWYDHQK
jgi:hypothetical protein